MNVTALTRLFRWALRFLCVAAAITQTGCGAGAVLLGVFGFDDNGSSGSGNQLPVIDELRILDARTSPATISFVLRDHEGDPVDVEVLVSPPGSSEARPALLREGQTKDLETSAKGKRHKLSWDFAAQVPTKASFVEGYTVTVRAGAAERILDNVAIGNDPPEVLDVFPRIPEIQDDVVGGVINIGIVVRDSSDDLVSVRGEYALRDQPGDTSTPEWKPLRPAGDFQETPEFERRGVEASRDGRALEVFWNIAADLGSREDYVQLQFTLWDGDAWGEPARSEIFRVDNNEPPILRIAVQAFLDHLDRRRGVPIPFDVSDTEGDDVRVVFQWRLRSGPDFPTLPETRAEMEEVLLDPERRRELQIANERPRVASGRVAALPQGEDTAVDKVRLPEVASSAATLLARGMEGREIEILRHANKVEILGEDWDLESPVAAIPIGDGQNALVLDSPAAGTWRLRELELATGEPLPLREVSGAGDPAAMALVRGGGSVLVATENGGDSWSVHVIRIDLLDEPVQFTLHPEEQPELSGAVRGLTSLGTNAALLTVGGAIARLDYYEGEPVKVVKILAAGLTNPRGIVLDPLNPKRIYLAEAGDGGENPGGVVALDVTTLEKIPVVQNGSGFPGASSIALGRRGARLLVVTDEDPEDGKHELRSLELGIKDVEVFEIEGERLAGDVGCLGTGPDGLRLLALTSENRLAVWGGVEQRRTIVGYDKGTQVATVSDAFEPAPEPLDRWRIHDRFGLLESTPGGAEAVFVWESADVAPGSEVELRGVAFDTEAGVGDVVRHSVAQPFHDPLELGGLTGDQNAANDACNLAIADLNGDGAPDVLRADGSDASLTMFHQGRPGEFHEDLSQRIMGGFPVTVFPADFDGDGDLDIVAANWGDVATFALYRNEGNEYLGPEDLPGHFDEGELGPCIPLPMDLNADGKLDVVLSNCDESTSPVILRQKSDQRGFPGVGDFLVEILPLDPGIRGQPVGVAAGDLDGDGRSDFVVGREDSGRVGSLIAFLQSRPGSFESVPLDPAGEDHWGVYTVDMDADGDLDLLSTSQVNLTPVVLRIFEQHRPGVFDSRVTYESLASNLVCVNMPDLDGDGDLDLIVPEVRGDLLSVLVFFKRPGGQFPAAPDFTIDAPLQAPHQHWDGAYSLATADLDGDADLDFALSNLPGQIPNLFVYLQRGLGDFVPEDVEFFDFAGDSSLIATAAADLDGDGDVDLVATERNGRFTVLWQTSPGAFESRPVPVFDLENPPRQPQAIAVADIDGDGTVDVVSANTSGDLRIFHQGVTRSTPPIEVNRPYAVGVADLNGDGRLDLVTASSDDAVSVFYQDDPGRFTAGPILEHEKLKQPRALVARDFDGDGKVDIASANRDTFTVFFQDESGAFGATPGDFFASKIANSVSRSLAADDLDGNGLLDAVLVAGGAVAIRLQDDAREFREIESVYDADGGGVPWGVAIADLDADGDPDLVVASSSGNRLSIFLQTTPGEFVRSQFGILDHPTRLKGPRSLVVADLDGDTDLDILSANLGSHNLSVFWGGR